MAISSPLLEDLSIDGAHGVLINITGGPDLTLYEVNEASTLIQEAAHEDANIIFGAVIDESIPEGEMRVTVIATGLEGDKMRRGRDRDVLIDDGKVTPLRREPVPVERAPISAERSDHGARSRPRCCRPRAARTAPAPQRKLRAASRRRARPSARSEPRGRERRRLDLAVRGRARRADLPAQAGARARRDDELESPAFLRRSAD
jgi:cell division protein FtsZ